MRRAVDITILVLLILFIELAPAVNSCYVALAMDHCWNYDHVISSPVWLIIFSIMSLSEAALLSIFILVVNKNQTGERGIADYFFFIFMLVASIVWIIVGIVAVSMNNLDNCDKYSFITVVISIIIQGINAIFCIYANIILLFFK
jgi:hypothetical protein